MTGQESQDLIESWHDNASAWTDAVRGMKIESRRLVTDTAIVEAIQSLRPRTVLDLGCGEGWLCRRLQELGIEASGFDVSQPLIESAKAASDARYFQCSYAEYRDAPAQFGRFDVIVANFSILDDELPRLLSALQHALNPHGAVIIQTIHPGNIPNDGEHANGWRVESFSGFNGDFPRSMPWYFRTLSSWQQCFMESGLHLREIREPVHPKTGGAASIIFIAGREP